MGRARGLSCAAHPLADCDQNERSNSVIDDRDGHFGGYDFFVEQFRIKYYYN
jgi:hypothetical protein